MAIELHADRRLVLHADDFGMNRAVNAGILRGFREGLLTSTSLLANAPDVEWALGQWRELEAERSASGLPSARTRRRLGDPDAPFDLGVHLNLTQGRPLTAGGFPDELLDAEGRFLGVFALFVRLQRSPRDYRAALRAELERQVARLCYHGLRPTHLNGHQYIEMMPPVDEIVTEVLDSFEIGVVRVAREPSVFRSTVLRGRFWRWPLARVKRVFAERFSARIAAMEIGRPDAFFGTAHAGDVRLDLLRAFLNNGKMYACVEVGLHPGGDPGASARSPADAADGWGDPLAETRPAELRMLLSAELPTELERAGRRLGRLAELATRPRERG